MSSRSTVGTADRRGLITSGAGRFAPLDGLRAVAVLLVFATHVVGPRAPGGWIGVTVFFGLSGYLITSLLMREHDRKGAIDLRAFYIRRALRLAPALVAMVAVVAPIAWWCGMNDVGWTALAALTYTTDIYAPLYGIDQIFTQTWSLAVEEQFYLVWPLVLILCLRRGWSVGRSAAVAAAASFLTGGVLAATVSPVAAHYTPFPHLPIMLGGAVLAVAVRNGHPGLSRLATWWIPAVAAVSALAVFLWVKDGTPWLYFGGIIAVGVPLVLTVGHVVTVPDGAVAGVLRLRPLVWLGERSYGFYLWHFPVAWLVQASAAYRVPLALAAPIVALVLTQASWVCVERPFLRLKSRFSTV